MAFCTNNVGKKIIFLGSAAYPWTQKFNSIECRSDERYNSSIFLFSFVINVTTYCINENLRFFAVVISIEIKSKMVLIKTGFYIAGICQTPIWILRQQI